MRSARQAQLAGFWLWNMIAALKMDFSLLLLVLLLSEARGGGKNQITARRF
jgi:hypothetical protein